MTIELSDADRRLIGERVGVDGPAPRHDCIDYVLRAMRERIEEDLRVEDELHARLSPEAREP